MKWLAVLMLAYIVSTPDTNSEYLAYSENMEEVFRTKLTEMRQRFFNEGCKKTTASAATDGSGVILTVNCEEWRKQ